MSFQPRLCLQFTDPCADLLHFKSSPTTKATKELVPVQLGNTLNITYILCVVHGISCTC